MSDRIEFEEKIKLSYGERNDIKKQLKLKV